MGEEEEEEVEVDEEEPEASQADDDAHADDDDAVDERPPEKEWRDEFVYYIAGDRIKVRTESVLEKWAVHAMADDIYWMMHELGFDPTTGKPQAAKAPAGDDAEGDGEGGEGPAFPDIHKKLVLEYLADGEYVLKAPTVEEPKAGGDDADAAAAGDEEDEGDEDGEKEGTTSPPQAPLAAAPAVEEDDEPPVPYALVEVDVFTLIVSQSVECAGFLLKHLAGKVQFATAVEVSCLSLYETAAGRKLMQDLLAAVQASRGGADAPPATATTHRMDFTPIFDAANENRHRSKEATGEYYAFYDRTLEALQHAGVGPACPVDTTGFTRMDDFLLLYNMLMRARDDDLDRVGLRDAGDDEDDAAGGGDEDEEGGGKAAAGPPALPAFFIKAMRVFRNLEAQGVGNALRVVCPGESVIEGEYTKRGKENGHPRYWKGDPVKGAEPCWLYCTATNGWQIRVGDAPAYISRAVLTEADLKPIQPCAWTTAAAPCRSVDLHIITDAHSDLLPRKLYKVLEVPKADPVLTRWLGHDDRPSVKRTVYASDFLLMVLLLQSGNASQLAFNRLLAWKVEKVRPTGEPTGWAHLVYAAAPRAEYDICHGLLQRTWKVFQPAGLVSLETFIRDIAPHLDVRLVAEAVPLTFPYADLEGPFMQKMIDDATAYAQAAKKYAVVKEKTDETFAKANCSPEEIGLLRQQREQHGLVFDATTLATAMRAGNVRGTAFLLDEVGLEPYMSNHIYQEGQPLMPYALQHKQTEMLLMLIERNFDLNSTWDHGLVAGVEYVRAHFPAVDCERVLEAWRVKELERHSNPALRYGILRKLAPPEGAAAAASPAA